MHFSQPTVPGPREIFQLLREHVVLWLLPAAAISAAIGLYAVFHESTWEASQAVIVRNEAFSAEKGPGKFSYPEEMKTVQETILEVARGRGVLEAALAEVGPPSDCDDTEAWPSDEDIDDARENVEIVPPKGAEFGTTEVFYLNVKDADRARAVAMNEAIFKRLRDRFMLLRDAKAQSVIDELTKTVRLAKADLDEATAALSVTERRLGGDLAELRSMQEMASSDSALRRSGEEIRAQIRANAAVEKENRELLAVVTAAQKDPRYLVSAPNQLLKSHDSLRRLKDGLIDAQLRTDALLGIMSADHPKVRTAQVTEEEIAGDLREELAVARQGIELELRICRQKHDLLEEQLAKAVERLENLTEVRAEYANQTASAKHRIVLLERAEANLSEARSALAGAKAASLISRIDSPDTGSRPVGPSRGAIALGGVVGGLLAGFGLLFLVVPLNPRTSSTSTLLVAVGHRRRVSQFPETVVETRPRIGVGCRMTVTQALQTLAG
ncbi:MAG: hypothetical protein JW959_05005 [Pirellulales bacterium]|nr:hypothetical protein [Pirellulales bacterium]